MVIEDKKELLVKFPEDSTGTIIGGVPPNNPVDKAADFLPRALLAIRDNFKEAVFLFVMLSYTFIAAFGHMERIRNYLGYFFVLITGMFLYKIWDKFTWRDLLYILVIMFLLIYIVSIHFNISIPKWF